MGINQMGFKGIQSTNLANEENADDQETPMRGRGGRRGGVGRGSIKRTAEGFVDE